MKKKIIFVTYASGREGTSALVGLVNLIGVPVSVNFRDVRNPKGYFEDPPYFSLLHKHLPDFFTGPPTLPIGLEQAEAEIKKSMPVFKSYLDKELKDKESLVIKSPKYICIFQIQYLLAEYDCKIIVTERSVKPMVKSIQKMWANDENKREIPEEDIANHIENWRKFGEEAMRKYADYAYLSTSFEAIMDKKIETANSIADFVGLPHPKADDVNNWLDEKLVNRAKYEENIFQKIGFKIKNFFEKKAKK